MNFLQLFAEGAATGSEATDTNAQNAAATEPAGTPAERKTFEQLLEDAEYKAAYDKHVKDAVGKRMRNVNEKVNQAKAAEPIMERLRERYGAESAEDILAALDKDDAWMDERAAAAGMPKEAFRKMNEMQRQLDRQQMDAEEAARQAEWTKVLADADRVAGMYPGFNMDAEASENPMFLRLVSSFAQAGLEDPVQKAYEAVHRDELLQQRVTAAVAQSQQNMANAIATGNQRPAENGATAAPSASKIDPAKLSRQQRDDIRKRVLNGEKITF